jgi:hypothetical protein
LADSAEEACQICQPGMFTFPDDEQYCTNLIKPRYLKNDLNPKDPLAESTFFSISTLIENPDKISPSLFIGGSQLPLVIIQDLSNPTTYHIQIPSQTEFDVSTEQIRDATIQIELSSPTGSTFVYTIEVQIFTNSCLFMDTFSANVQSYLQIDELCNFQNSASCSILNHPLNNPVPLHQCQCSLDRYGDNCDVVMVSEIDPTITLDLYQHQTWSFTFSSSKLIPILISVNSQTALAAVINNAKSFMYTASTLGANSIQISFNGKIALSLNINVFACDSSLMAQIGCNLQNTLSCVQKKFNVYANICLCKPGYLFDPLCSSQTPLTYSPINELSPLVTSLLTSNTFFYSGQKVEFGIIQYTTTAFFYRIRDLFQSEIRLAPIFNLPNVSSGGQIIDIVYLKNFSVSRLDTFFTALSLTVLPKCEWLQANTSTGTSCFTQNTLSCNLAAQNINQLCTCKDPEVIPSQNIQRLYGGTFCEKIYDTPLGPFYATQQASILIRSHKDYGSTPPSVDLKYNDDALPYEMATLMEPDSSTHGYFLSFTIPPSKSPILVKSGPVMTESTYESFKTDSFTINGLKTGRFAQVNPCYWTELTNYSISCNTEVDQNGDYVAITGCINPQTGKIQCMCRKGFNLNECRYHISLLTESITPDQRLSQGQDVNFRIDLMNEYYDRKSSAIVSHSLIFQSTLEATNTAINGPRGAGSHIIKFDSVNSLRTGPTPLFISPIQVSLLIDTTDIVWRDQYTLVPSLTPVTIDTSQVLSPIDFSKPPSSTVQTSKTSWGLECPYGVHGNGCVCARENIIFPDCSYYIHLEPLSPEYYIKSISLPDSTFVYTLHNVKTHTKKTTQTQIWPETVQSYHFELNGVRLQAHPDIPNSIIIPRLPLSSPTPNSPVKIDFVVDQGLIGQTMLSGLRYTVKTFTAPQSNGHPRVQYTTFYDISNYYNSPGPFVPPFPLVPYNFKCLDNGFYDGRYKTGFMGSNCLDMVSYLTDATVRFLNDNQNPTLTIPFTYLPVRSNPNFKYDFYLLPEKLSIDDTPQPLKLNFDINSRQFTFSSRIDGFFDQSGKLKRTALNFSLVSTISNPTSGAHLGTIILPRSISVSPTCLILSPLCSPEMILTTSDGQQVETNLAPNSDQHPQLPLSGLITFSNGQLNIKIPNYDDLLPQAIVISLKHYARVNLNGDYSTRSTTVKRVNFTPTQPINGDVIQLFTLPTNLVTEKAFISIQIPTPQTPPAVFVTDLFRIVPHCYSQCTSPNSICSSETQQCVCATGFTGPNCSESASTNIPVTCPKCNSLHTSKCGDNNTCICKTDFVGQFCDTHVSCSTQSTTQCRNGHLISIENTSGQFECKNECECYNSWGSSDCSMCLLQCQNGGLLYKSCDKCGCNAGYTGNRCQCRSTVGSIVLNGYNFELIDYFNALKSLDINNGQTNPQKLIIPSPIPSSLTELYSYARLIDTDVENVIGELLGIDAGSVKLDITVAGGDPIPNNDQITNRTTRFAIVITFNCQEYNNNLTIDALGLKWDKLGNLLIQSEPVLNYFIFNDPTNPVGTDPLTETPSTLPGDDDRLEENGVGLGYFGTGMFTILVLFGAVFM